MSDKPDEQHLPPLPVVRAADLDDSSDSDTWLVERLWMDSAVGIIGGAPKCCKSWLGLDVALSVASGTPCLDTFPISAPGPTLLYMAEDAAPVVKARLTGICRHRGLDLTDLPIHVITAPALRLDLQRDQDRLLETVSLHRPSLLLLDPFVRLHRIDENHAGDVSALLAYLRQLQRQYDMAIVVVHHSRKNGRASTPGQNLRGSGDFHAWADSSLYLRRKQSLLVLTPEHRSAPACDNLTLSLATDDQEAVHLEIIDAPDEVMETRRNLEEDILALLRASPVPMPRSQLRAAMQVRNKTLGQALNDLAAANRIVRKGQRWAIPIPGPT